MYPDCYTEKYSRLLKMIKTGLSHSKIMRYMGLILLICWGLNGCGPIAATPGGFNLISGQAEILSIIGTEKTIFDHAISLSSGKNCSSVRREKGLHYCEEDEPEVRPNVYCYNTLARVTCYKKPDPYLNGSRILGNNDHNLVKPNAKR